MENLNSAQKCSILGTICCASLWVFGQFRNSLVAEKTIDIVINQPTSWQRVSNQMTSWR